mmetsp:Transcript_84011/g.246430  ORF Transcript_84011/g.246430 Transcript_84011/m.246430 type:complete len:203 (+) Transcript_84011:495-1103(+)
MVLELLEYRLREVAFLGRLVKDGAISPAFLLAISPSDLDALSVEDADAPRYAKSWSPVLGTDVGTKPLLRHSFGFFCCTCCGRLFFCTTSGCSLLSLDVRADGCLQVPIVAFEQSTSSSRVNACNLACLGDQSLPSCVLGSSSLLRLCRGVLHFRSIPRRPVRRKVPEVVGMLGLRPDGLPVRRQARRRRLRGSRGLRGRRL